LLLTDLTSGEQLVKFAEDQRIDQIFIGIVKKSKSIFSDPRRS
jgi:hypothetical protein